MANLVIGRQIKTVESERRIGNTLVLIGSRDQVKSLLSWNPQYAYLKQIISQALAWHQKNHV